MKTLLTILSLLLPLAINAATITPVNVGAGPNDGTGDSIRVAFMKINTNIAAINAGLSNVSAGIVLATNVTTTNAVRFGIYKETVDGVLEFFGLQQGTNIVMYRTASNIVINATSTGDGGGGDGSVTHEEGDLDLDLPILGNNGDDIKSTSVANYLSILSVPTHAQLVTASNTIRTALTTLNTATSNGLYSIETTRNDAVFNSLAALIASGDTVVSNGVVTLIIATSNTLYSVETTRNAAVSNALVTYIDVASTNRLRFVAGTGGTTVTSVDSGSGLRTITISDDDVGSTTGSSSNATQFGASTQFTIKDGALLTNIVLNLPSNSMPIIAAGGYVTNAQRIVRYETNVAPILSNLIAAATSGTVIQLGAGDFHIGGQSLRLPVGVTLRGMGKKATTLSGWSILFTNGPMIVPASSNLIEDLTINGWGSSSNYMAGIGMVGQILVGNIAATNFVVRDVDLINFETDAIYLSPTNFYSARFERVFAQSTWDVYIQSSQDPEGSNYVEVAECTFISDRRGALHPNSISNNRSTGTQTAGRGVTVINNSRIVTTNANTTYSVNVQANARVYLNSCVVEAAGTNLVAKGDNISFSSGDARLIINNTAMTDSDLVEESTPTYVDEQFSHVKTADATVSSRLSIQGRLSIQVDRGTNGQTVFPFTGASGPSATVLISSNITWGLSGTALHGDMFSITHSNIVATNCTVGIQPGYSIRRGGTASTWVIPATNKVRLVYQYLTNDTGGNWEIIDTEEREATFGIEAGLSTNAMYLKTNGLAVTVAAHYIPQPASAGGTNLANGAAVAVGSGTFSTNVNAASGIVTNGLGRIPQTASGFGGANTNVVTLAMNDVTYLNAGTTNVHLLAIMHGTAGVQWFPVIILTNYTTTARSLSLGSVSNQWVNLQQYDGVTAPYVVSNKHTAILTATILGSNTIYAFKQATNGF